MSQIAFRNAVTELFGTRLPIVAGGLMWLADADYVAAASRAGIIGFITAASFPEPQALRAEIRRCRELCEGGPFGVNVSMLPKLVPGEKTREVFELIVDEGVKFVETSGRNPEEFLPLLKEAGVKVLHKVPAVRFAVKAAALGVDAVAIVGAECGGHPGLDMVGSFVIAAWAESQLDIPYLIGGGIGRGSQLAAALAMGASGVVVGTRFAVAEEIWAHADYKQRLVDAGPTDTELSMQSLRNTVRTLRNETTAAVKEIEAQNPNVTIQDLMPMVAGKIGRNAYVTGDWSKGLLSAGQSLAFVDRIEPLADIVLRFERDMWQAMGRLVIA
ncbi:NAD(P)H-dependent flavin oxidoreductase [Paraburkholderia hospita]|uniref:NAD(P)H-dependent flavin oxidoreductase n=1 Tax=Paraburkholderia hospita TaxID=169430 RepID=UPI000271CFE4|nr:nitronate monooxygenase [Paraburkholderia hospita]EUC11752.1 2-nitropropane dioxygenase NPD [Burkholderia sp. BT03]SKD07489.1 NAD(P)H-dependent flavin oxidoreductase YrpB, nitropropane dioxygenase family [Paraburkholderia hospita]